MSERATDRTYPVTPASDGAAPGELSWTALFGVAPALLRASLLAGQRLLDRTSASVVSLTRTVGTGSPGALIDGAVEPLRRLLGIPQIEADLRRLLADIGAADSAWGRPEPTPAPTSTDVAPPPLPPQPPIPTPPPAAQPEAAEPEVAEAEVAEAAEPEVAEAEPEVAEPEPEVAEPEVAEPEVAEPDPTPPSGDDEPAPAPAPPGLRERGERLLARSATLEPDEEHPAFGLVLEQVAPDEMRILRLLALDGDQPAIDVESGGRLGGKGRPVATRISLLGENAGAKHVDRLPVYLDNLERLGLLRIGDHPVADVGYEVIEAQPRTDEARAQAARAGGRARMLRRRIGLTHFGRSFCDTCLPDAARARD